MSRYLLLLLILFAISNAGRLLTNGDFEYPLSTGWYSIFGLANTYDTIDRQTYFHPDPDYEVRVKKYDAVYAKLSQTVNVPTTNLQFGVSAKLYALEYNPSATYWAAAAVCLRYLDANGNQLGETRIAHMSPHCPWTNTNTVHIIPVTDPNNWYDYRFNVNNELANLPGVNPSQIRKIQVALLDTTDGC